MRYSRGRRRKSEGSGITGALLTLLFVLPIASMLTKPKKRKPKKRNINKVIDDHYK
jgi:hypothetical protein